MPNYAFRNKDTGEEFNEWMKISERENYLSEHPELEQMLIGMTVVDPVRLGVTKPPRDFQKYVLGRIRDTAPGAKKDLFSKRYDIAKEI